MGFFELFLPVTATLLSLLGLGVSYWVISQCKEGEFIPTYYFIAFSIVAVLFMSLSRVSTVIFGSELFNYALLQDLMVSWAALFLFGALWQSYETSVVMVPDKLKD